MPFNEAIAWSDFFQRQPKPVQIDEVTPAASEGDATGDVITSTTTAADTRNVQELQNRIAKAGGVLTANANSSDYIVAINNRLRFSVTRTANGQFEIRNSQNYLLVIGLAVVVGVLVLARK